MANPQLENGFTMIANEYKEAKAKIRIPGEAGQILEVVERQTWGFKKTWDYISISQFSFKTGLLAPNVCRGIAKLLSMNIIIKNDKGNTSKFRINKNYEEWIPLSKRRRNDYHNEHLAEKCYICNYKETLHAHHITPKSKGGSNHYANKINLCPNCHALAHKNKISKEKLFLQKDKVEKSLQKDNKNISSDNLPVSKQIDTKDTLTKDTKELSAKPEKITNAEYPFKVQSIMDTINKCYSQKANGGQCGKILETAGDIGYALTSINKSVSWGDENYFKKAMKELKSRELWPDKWHEEAKAENQRFADWMTQEFGNKLSATMAKISKEI